MTAAAAAVSWPVLPALVTRVEDAIRKLRADDPFRPRSTSSSRTTYSATLATFRE